MFDVLTLNLALMLTPAYTPAPFPRTPPSWQQPEYPASLGGRGWVLCLDGAAGGYHVYLYPDGSYLCGGWRGRWRVQNRRTLFVIAHYTLDDKNRTECFQVDLPSARGIFLLGDDIGRQFAMRPSTSED